MTAPDSLTLEQAREAIAKMRADLAESQPSPDLPEMRFFAAVVRLIELAVDDAAYHEGLNERTRQRAERIGGDGHTWAMHRPEWGAARDAAAAWLAWEDGARG